MCKNSDWRLACVCVCVRFLLSLLGLVESLVLRSAVFGVSWAAQVAGAGPIRPSVGRSVLFPYLDLFNVYLSYLSLSLSLLFAYPFPLGESVVRRGERDTGTGFVVARLRPSKTEHTHTQTHFDVCLTVCRVCWRFPSCLVGQKRREKRPRQDSILNGAIKSVKKSSAGDSPFKYNKKTRRRNKKSQNGFLLVPS